MKCRTILLHAAILLLLQGGDFTGGEARGSDAPLSAGAGTEAALVREIALVEGRLRENREELARLRHKWLVTKGRTPTQQEIKVFEEKLAKGKAKPLDNPFYNKNPLTTPAPARAAYYAQLEEVRQDEERLRQLKEALASRTGGP